MFELYKHLVREIWIFHGMYLGPSDLRSCQLRLHMGTKLGVVDIAAVAEDFSYYYVRVLVRNKFCVKRKSLFISTLFLPNPKRWTTKTTLNRLYSLHQFNRHQCIATSWRHDLWWGRHLRQGNVAMARRRDTVLARWVTTARTRSTFYTLTSANSVLLP